MHPSGAMEIRFDKPSFKYVAGQWLYLSVPEVSKYQWHPFTISSAPDDPYVSVHIRQAGDFTRALGERLGCTADLAKEVTEGANGKRELAYGEGKFVDYSGALLAAGRMPLLRIDGPYGAPAEDVFKSEGQPRTPRSLFHRTDSTWVVAVLVGTGIGVTPFASILKNIWSVMTVRSLYMHHRADELMSRYMQKKGKLGALRRVEFIWINRDTGSFEWFQALLRQLEDVSLFPPPHFTIQLTKLKIRRHKPIPTSSESTLTSQPRYQKT